MAGMIRLGTDVFCVCVLICFLFVCFFRMWCLLIFFH